MSSGMVSGGAEFCRLQGSMVPASTSKLSSRDRSILFSDCRLIRARSDWARRLLPPRTFFASCFRSSDQRALSSGDRFTLRHTSGRFLRRDVVALMESAPTTECAPLRLAVSAVEGALMGGSLTVLTLVGSSLVSLPFELMPMIEVMFVNVSEPMLSAPPMTLESPSDCSLGATDDLVSGSSSIRNTGAPKRWCRKFATSTKSSSNATSKVTRQGQRARVLNAWWSLGVIRSTLAHASEDLQSGR
mmetsp:Transcript_3018/g.12202  ORF Transcript_3018/g.12202 Transcript_3018/m.12202 type:complete len:245 (+) Transcript_3018:982-1716(+)